jgi:hypothetical protein
LAFGWSWTLEVGGAVALELLEHEPRRTARTAAASRTRPVGREREGTGRLGMTVLLVLAGRRSRDAELGE